MQGHIGKRIIYIVRVNMNQISKVRFLKKDIEISKWKIIIKKSNFKLNKSELLLIKIYPNFA